MVFEPPGPTLVVRIERIATASCIDNGNERIISPKTAHSLGAGGAIVLAWLRAETFAKSRLVSVIFPNWKIGKSENIYLMFLSCREIRKRWLPDTIKPVICSQWLHSFQKCVRPDTAAGFPLSRSRDRDPHHRLVLTLGDHARALECTSTEFGGAAYLLSFQV